MDFVHEEGKDLKNIFTRFRKGDFSGNTGQAIKNSSYQLATNIVAKVGSLLFTVIIARMLLPELFGLYSLALGTIVLFSAFSDLGIGAAIITFISKSLGKKDKGKAKGYFKKLLKWKIYLLILASIILGIVSYFIANYYYQKPIFYALLAGILYIPVVGITAFFEYTFKANNNFKIPLIREIIFQAFRLLIVPIGILLFFKFGLSSQKIIFGVILILIFCYLLTVLYLLFYARKEIGFFKVKSKNLGKKDKKRVIKFLIPLSTIALSGVFYGYIDTFMLGHYVSTQYIAYYGAAFALIGSASILIGFAAGALLPIFARKEGNQLESIFKKTRDFTIVISFLGSIFTYLIAYWIILITYGNEYLSAVGLLKIFALLILILPISAVYESYFTAKEKTRTIMWLLISSTIINVILNIIGITYGLNHFGEMGAVYGACIATIISRFFYIFGQIIFRKR